MEMCRTASDFSVKAKLVLQQAQRTVVSKMTEAAKEIIDEKSKGTLKVVSKETDKGAFIGVAANESSKESILQVERHTSAFGEAYEKLSDKAFVSNLIKGDK